MTKFDKFSLIIPCFNEEKTLQECIERVIDLDFYGLNLEIVIVDDFSSDDSFQIAEDVSKRYDNIRVFRHDQNYGKGAAIRTGLGKIEGDIIGIQDADLEYDPLDLVKLVGPIVDGKADVSLGSRYLTTERRRVLYFWHTLANKFLTTLSNMVTDLNLTDMETCYKVFTKEALDGIAIEENRFGFEPEIVSKIASKKLRVFEMGISYEGRTFDEGKKIGYRDALQAILCILKYGAPNSPLPVHVLFYLCIGLLSAGVNVISFLAIKSYLFNETLYAAPIAFVFAALTNYYLCIKTIFRYKRLWGTTSEFLIYSVVVTGILIFDLISTQELESQGYSSVLSKILAIIFGFVLNYVSRRFIIFPRVKEITK